MDFTPNIGCMNISSWFCFVFFFFGGGGGVVVISSLIKLKLPYFDLDIVNLLVKSHSSIKDLVDILFGFLHERHYLN